MARFVAGGSGGTPDFTRRRQFAPHRFATSWARVGTPSTLAKARNQQSERFIQRSLCGIGYIPHECREPITVHRHLQRQHGRRVAAYCAAASIACQIAVVETAPDAKLLQMMAYGAKIYRVERFGIDPVVTEQVFDSLLALADRPDAALQISAFKYSPLGMAGVQTISYEIARQNNRVQHVFVPAGGGGLTLAVAHGFPTIGGKRQPRVTARESIAFSRPETTRLPDHCDAGAHAAIDVSCTTAISGLQVPSVIDGNEVVELCRATGGTGYTVADDDVYAVQRRLAQQEGIFCEPAGAVAVTAALAAVASGEIDGRDEIVCLVTGSGFKDLASAERIKSGNVCRTVSCDRLGDCMVA